MTATVARVKKTPVLAHDSNQARDGDALRASAIELRVRQACRAVPRGHVATYGTIAKVVGTGPRAVGQFMRRNPYAPARGYAPRTASDPPAVPCHRVVASQGMIGGFRGHASLNQGQKMALLRAEGVEFRANGQLDRADKLVGQERLKELLERLVEQDATDEQARTRAKDKGAKAGPERKRDVVAAVGEDEQRGDDERRATSADRRPGAPTELLL